MVGSMADTEPTEQVGLGGMARRNLPHQMLTKLDAKLK